MGVIQGRKTSLRDKLKAQAEKLGVAKVEEKVEVKEKKHAKK